MKYSNKLGLPEFVVEALKYSDYNGINDDCNISVSRLISPPHIVRLREKYDDEITVDVSTRIWSMLGQIGHNIVSRLENYENKNDYIVETRFENTIEYHSIKNNETKTKTINGQVDCYQISTKTLYDNKFVSIGSILYAEGNNKYNPRKEWIQQLNIYAWLLRSKGYEVEKIQVIAWIRDLSQFKKDMNDIEGDVHILDVPLWRNEEIEEFIKRRLNMLEQETTECTEEERWHKPAKYLIKYPNKISKTFYSYEQAREALKEGGTIEIVKESNIRCERYCELNNFCQFYKNNYSI